MSPLAEKAKAEIESLHAHLVGLFTRRHRDLARCETAFAPGLSMITPDGSCFDRARILANLANASAAPDFQITIRDVQSIWESETAVLLRYIEEQYRDGETTRRLSSALFTADGTAPMGVVWRHLHETWQETKEVGGNLK
jgi:hypothetical protein